MKGVYSGRQIKDLKGRSQKVTRSQTASSAYAAIMAKYGSIQDNAHYYHLGKGNWHKYSLENDKKRTGKLAESKAIWAERPNKFDWAGIDTRAEGKPAGKKLSFSVSSLKASAPVGRKGKATQKLVGKPVTKAIKITTEDKAVAALLKRNRETQNPLKLPSKNFVSPVMKCEKLIESAKKRKTASKWLKDEVKTWETRREKYGLNAAEQQKLCILYSTLTNTQTNNNPLYDYCKTCNANKGSAQKASIKEQPKKSTPQRIALKDVTNLHGKYRYASFMRPLGSWFNPGTPFRIETVTASDRDFRYNRAPHSVISTGSRLSEETLKKFELVGLAEGKKLQELIKYARSFDFLNDSMKGQLEDLILKGKSKAEIDKYIEKGRKMSEKKSNPLTNTVKKLR